MYLKLLLIILCPLSIYGVPIAYVTDNNTDLITPIDLATNTPLTPIIVAAAPTDITISPNGKRAYVISTGSSTTSTVSVVDLTTNTVIKEITVGNNHFQVPSIVISPDGTLVYATNINDNTVSVISTASNTIIATITGLDEPQDTAFTLDSKIAYITNFANDTVSVVNVPTNAIIATLSTNFNGPSGITISPDGTTAYVANFNGNSVTPITIATNAVGTPISVGTGPENIAVTPDGTIAYVVNEVAGTVTPILTASKTAETSFSVGGVDTFPFDIVITPDGTKGVVTVQALNLTQLFNIPADTLDGSVSTAFPLGLAIAPFILPPTNATAQFKQNKFLNTTDCVLVGTIVPATSSSPLAFNIYQNGNLVGQITSTSFELCVSDCNVGGFTVTAVGANGVESSQVPLVIF